MLCEKCNNNIPKSIQQLRYWHVAKKVLSEQTGYSPDEIGLLIKKQLGKFKEFANKKTGEVHTIYESAGTWNVKEFTEVIENLLQLVSEWDLVLLTPDEFYEIE